jgi:hypothetical protein
MRAGTQCWALDRDCLTAEDLGRVELRFHYEDANLAAELGTQSRRTVIVT